MRTRTDNHNFFSRASAFSESIKTGPATSEDDNFFGRLLLVSLVVGGEHLCVVIPIIVNSGDSGPHTDTANSQSWSQFPCKIRSEPVCIIRRSTYVLVFCSVLRERKIFHAQWPRGKNAYIPEALNYSLVQNGAGPKLVNAACIQKIFFLSFWFLAARPSRPGAIQKKSDSWLRNGLLLFACHI